MENNDLVSFKEITLYEFSIDLTAMFLKKGMSTDQSKVDSIMRLILGKIFSRFEELEMDQPFMKVVNNVLTCRSEDKNRLKLLLEVYTEVFCDFSAERRIDAKIIQERQVFKIFLDIRELTKKYEYLENKETIKKHKI